jgi:hypothetical protein
MMARTIYSPHLWLVYSTLIEIHLSIGNWEIPEPLDHQQMRPVDYYAQSFQVLSNYGQSPNWY